MNKDFHYGVVKVLARAAGFPEKEADWIAHASQHVDDANLHQSMIFKDLDDLDLKKMQDAWVQALGGGFKPDKPIVEKHADGLCFEPVCTLHHGLEYVHGLKKEAQRKVYVSFHFVPPNTYVKGKPYSYCAEPGKGAAADLANRIAETLFQDSCNDRQLALIALGIALHSYADTWAHEGFSGLRSAKDNDLSAVFVDGKKQKKSLEGRLGGWIAIGHLEAFNYPDTPHHRIRFDFERGARVKRSNVEHFLLAARAVLEVLCRARGADSQKPWAMVEKSLGGILAASLNSARRLVLMEASFKGRKGFAGMKFAYDKMDWERLAVHPRFETNEFSAVIHRRNGKDSRWFKYHVAASVQRGFVRKHIKPVG